MQERIMCSRLQKYLKDQNILDYKQFGFQTVILCHRTVGGSNSQGFREN